MSNTDINEYFGTDLYFNVGRKIITMINLICDQHLNLLKWFVPDIDKVSRFYKNQFCVIAARSSTVEILKYFGIDNLSDFDGYYGRKIMNNAAKNGNLQIIQYIRTLDSGDKFPWDEWTCDCAAKNGHLNVLKYLHDNGCRWNHRIYEFGIRSGQIEILEYLHENECSWDTYNSSRSSEMVT